MNQCPNCNSKNFALIVRGGDLNNLIEKFLELKQIYIDDIHDDSFEFDNSKWICNVCLNRWG
jgi:hypothetical protein